MKNFNHIVVFAVALMLMAACSSIPTPTPTQIFQGENPYVVQPGDSALMAGDITVDSASVFLTKSMPPQVLVQFNYFQPTPCHQLRVEVSGPDAQNHITLKGYAVAEKDQPCTLMALATPLSASLNLGSFPNGHYTVWLNDNQIGEFDS